MDYEKERKEFEKHFPIPYKCVFVGDKYQPLFGYSYTADCRNYQWLSWIKAKETVHQKA